MVPPQYVNQTFAQQPPPQRLQAQTSSPQLALPMAGMQYPGGAQQYPQYGGGAQQYSRPPAHPGTLSASNLLATELEKSLRLLPQRSGLSGLHG